MKKVVIENAIPTVCVDDINLDKVYIAVSTVTNIYKLHRVGDRFSFCALNSSQTVAHSGSCAGKGAIKRAVNNLMEVFEFDSFDDFVKWYLNFTAKTSGE